MVRTVYCLGCVNYPRESMLRGRPGAPAIYRLDPNVTAVSWHFMICHLKDHTVGIVFNKYLVSVSTSV